MGILSVNARVKCDGCGSFRELELYEIAGDSDWQFDAEGHGWQWTDRGLECESCCHNPDGEDE